MKLTGRVLTGATTGLLLVAIVFPFVVGSHVPPPGDAHPYAAIHLPPADGFVVHELPLGATEAVAQDVQKTLNLDDYSFREYKKAGLEFSIYVAYWRAGRMPARLVASHTPDRCWTESGMRCTELRYRERYSVDGQTLAPAEYRVFARPPQGDRIYVAYWHLADGRPYDYGDRFNAVPSAWRWWKNVVDEAASGSPEQLFVRVSSPQSIDALWRDAGFRQVMGRLAALWLGAGAAAP